MRLRIFIYLIFLFYAELIQAQTQIIYDEQFDNNVRCWAVGENETHKTEIKNGKFIIELKSEKDPMIFYTYSSLEPKLDYHVETKLKLSKAGEKSNCGLFLMDDRIADEEVIYYFKLFPSGKFAILSFKPSTEEFTKHALRQIPDSILGKNIINENVVLSISKKDSLTSFYINKKLVYTEKKVQFWGNYIGFTLDRISTLEVDYLIAKQDRGKINLVEDFNSFGDKEFLGPEVNSDQSERPLISPDGKTLYISAHPEEYGIDSLYKQEIYFSSSDKDGVWQKRIKMGKTINSQVRNSIVAVSPDNNSIIVNGFFDKKGNYVAGGISISHRIKNGWSKPEGIEIEGFYNKRLIAEFCFSADMKVLIMALERINSQGCEDLYVSFRKDDGSFSSPINMGPTLNTFDAERSPFLAADGKTLYYATRGKVGYGGYDIYKSTRLDDSWKKWSEPLNLGPKINSPGGEDHYNIPASGEYAYMTATNGDVAHADIFRIKVPQKSKPQPVVIIYGTVYNKKDHKPIDAEITYHDLNTKKEVGIARSNPSDGTYKIVLPLGAAYGFLAEKENFFSESDNMDLHDLGEYKEVKRDLYLSPIEIGKSITLNNVFFVQSKAEILPESYPELDRLVNFLKENTNIKIQLEGHTENIGSADLNLKLSEDRVEVIKNYLVSKGIDQSRISGKGFGGTRPLNKSANEEEKKLNRRVEFKIISK